MKKLVVAGNDLMAIKAVSLIAGQCRSRALPDCELSAVLADSSEDATRLVNHCQWLDVPVIACRDLNSPYVLDQMERIGPDLVFSLGNLQILKNDFLEIPKGGVVNLHNALLPRHAGGNACTWALFEGDRMHGVTCHYVDRGVDTGDIIGQLGFPVKDDDTAFDLLIRCMQKALALLEKALPPLVAGAVRPIAQDLSKRTHHYFKELPHGGLIDFSWPAEKVCNLVRAMNLGPILDQIPRAKAFHRGKPFFVETAAVSGAGAEAEPGTVLVASRGRLEVAAGRGRVRVLSGRDGKNEPASPDELIRAHDLRPGCTLG